MATRQATSVNKKHRLKFARGGFTKRLFLSLLVLLSSTAAAWSQSLPACCCQAIAEVIVHNGKIYHWADDKKQYRQRWHHCRSGDRQSETEKYLLDGAKQINRFFP